MSYVTIFWGLPSESAAAVFNDRVSFFLFFFPSLSLFRIVPTFSATQYFARRTDHDLDRLDRLVGPP